MNDVICPKCRAYNGKHFPLCENNTPEQVKQHLELYFKCYQKTQERERKNQSWNQRYINKHKKYLTDLQGKIALLKQENNSLRKKLANR